MEGIANRVDQPCDTETERRFKERFQTDKYGGVVEHQGNYDELDTNEGRVVEKISEVHTSLLATSEYITHLTKRLQGACLPDEEKKETQDNLVHGRMSQLEFALAELNNSVNNLNDRLRRLITGLRL